ncbi:MAG: DUF938 domain-containing protein [Sphingobium sp.]|nr:DUF938 domain-containing protein [Sphingobium sp.]
MGDDGDARRHAPAALRNRDAISQVLARELPASGLVLEIASGSGEHALHFAKSFPALDWHPSDPDPAARASIAAWMEDDRPQNLRLPLDCDAMASDAWPIEHADAVLCINMVHISPWEATLGLFHGAARLLKAAAPLILYGPYSEDDVETAESNLTFDAWLRARDDRFGLRRAEDVDAVASGYGFTRTARISMPANNLMLVYRRRD